MDKGVDYNIKKIQTTALQRFKNQNILLKKFGENGLRIYKEIDNKKTAEEIRKKIKIDAEKFAKIIDFMENSGMIELVASLGEINEEKKYKKKIEEVEEIEEEVESDEDEDIAPDEEEEPAPKRKKKIEDDEEVESDADEEEEEPVKKKKRKSEFEDEEEVEPDADEEEEDIIPVEDEEEEEPVKKKKRKIEFEDEEEIESDADEEEEVPDIEEPSFEETEELAPKKKKRKSEFEDEEEVEPDADEEEIEPIDEEVEEEPVKKKKRKIEFEDEEEVESEPDEDIVPVEDEEEEEPVKKKKRKIEFEDEEEIEPDEDEDIDGFSADEEDGDIEPYTEEEDESFETDKDESSMEKIIRDKYGAIGLTVYELIDGAKSAEEIMKETGLTESKLIEILDFMEEKGIIKLEYPGKKKKGKIGKEKMSQEDNTLFKPLEDSESTLKQAPKGMETIDIPTRLPMDIVKSVQLKAKIMFELGDKGSKVFENIDGKNDTLDILLKTKGSMEFLMKAINFLLDKNAIFMRPLGRDEIEKKFGAEAYRIYKRFGRDGVLLYELIGKDMTIRDMMKRITTDKEKFIEMFIFVHDVLGVPIPVEKDILMKRLDEK